MPAREERGMGVPLDDAQRIARHYGISIEEACELLTIYSPGQLLPERGYGLATEVSVGEIVGSDLQDLALALNAVEDALPMGGQAKLELCTEELPTDDDLAVWYLSLAANGWHTGYPEARVVDGVPTTSIVLQKGSPAWAALIPLLVPALTIGLIAFGITKIETITKALLPLVLVAVGGVIIIAGLMRKPAERIVERAGQKYLPSTLPKALAAR